MFLNKKSWARISNIQILKLQVTNVFKFKLVDLNPLDLGNIKEYSTRKYHQHSNQKLSISRNIQKVPSMILKI